MGCELEYHQEEELSKCWSIKPGKFSFEKITINVARMFPDVGFQC